LQERFDLQCRPVPATILAMARSASERASSEHRKRTEPFVPGTMVIATLNNPREKFWGMILALAPEGLSLTGIELASFDDLTVMVRDQEPFTPAVVFFPMHRVERIELDLPDGNLPSLSQRFETKTGLRAASVLASHGSHETFGLTDVSSRTSKDRA
jgi:hypothetical protein